MTTPAAPNSVASEGDPASVTNTEWKQLCEVMNGYIYSQTLATACELDLFSWLSAHPGETQDQLAQRLGLSSHCTRVLMLACCAAGLVLRDVADAGYRNSEIAEKVLVAGSRYSMLPFIAFNHQVQEACVRRFTQTLRENRNAGLDEFPGGGATLYERLAEYPTLENLFHEAMGAYTRLSPKVVHLGEFGAVRHLLDVGGGDGSNAIALCERFPDLKVTIFEKPTVARIAREKIAIAGFEGRVACAEGDMFVDAWPTGCDAILFSHLVEIFSPKRIRGLYKKAFETLPSAGLLFVWTIMANDSETGALQAAKSSIYFLCAASGEGMAYPASQHEEALRWAGFGGVKRYPAVEVDHGALVAVK
jgi:O-methyltransferase domain/Dimerisation domain